MTTVKTGTEPFITVQVTNTLRATSLVLGQTGTFSAYVSLFPFINPHQFDTGGKIFFVSQKGYKCWKKEKKFSKPK